MTPEDLVQLFIDDELVTKILNETRLYALRNNRADPNLQRHDIYVFIAILIVTSYMRPVNTRLFWQDSADTHNDMVTQAMPRNKFDVIKRNLHFASEPVPEDRYWKVRPLILHLQAKFMENFVPIQNVSHDEAMIAYFGRHGLKQAIRNKPIRFGFKAWCQCSPDGYCLMFDLYQGASLSPRAEEKNQLVGKSGATVLDLLDNMREDLKQLPFHIYFDNFFTSVPLLQELTNRGYGGTGTIRENRIPGATGLTPSKDFKKKARGTYQTVESRDGSIMLVRWQDNAPVTLASSSFGSLPVGKVRRYSRISKTSIEVDRPDVVARYNENMGGVDRMDQNVNHCRIAVRGKKWNWPLVTWMFDVAINNAWRLHCCAGGNLSFLDFRREVACTFLRRWGKGHSSVLHNRRLAAPGTMAIRNDNIGHLVIRVDGRGRCRGEFCSSKISTKCEKCDVFVCVDCFSRFHKR